MSLFDRFRRRTRQDQLSCHEVGELLQSYLDGELGSESVARVSEHLEMCRRCGLEASVYTDIKDSLANSIEPPPESVRRLRDFGQRMAHGQLRTDDDPPGI